MARKTITITDEKLTEHFMLSEFYCNTDKAMLINGAFIYDFVPNLERFRVWYNRPINITSAFRTVSVNAAAGGSSNSSHLKALAIDFPYPAAYNTWTAARRAEFLNNVKTKWTDLAHAAGYGAQVNYYDNRFHIGFSLNGKDSYLDYRSKK